MTDVFISYASEDRERVRKLASTLEAHGWSVWWDRKIIAGQTFDQVIEHELETAKSVVVLWSNHSITSEWVKNEAAVASERGVLIPALIDTVKPPLEFRRKQTADLVGWDGDRLEEGFQALCDGVAAATKISSAAPHHSTASPTLRFRWNRRWTLSAIAALAIVLVFVAYRYLIISSQPKEISVREHNNEAVIQEKKRQVDVAVEDTKVILLTPESTGETIQTHGSNKEKKPIDVGDSQEQESNNGIFSSNNIPLDQWISGSIKDSSDADYFMITTPVTYQDVIKVELKNQTITAKPRIGVYNDNKEWLGGTSKYSHQVTAGQNQAYSFSSEPNTIYYIYIAFLDDSLGEYKFMVSPLRAYDSFEPNNDILNAKIIQLKKAIAANFTDRSDEDYYRIKTGSIDGSVTITFENLTPHIKPRIGVYDNNKKWLGGTSKYSHQVTAGQNHSYLFSAEANSVYYIYVANLSDTPGSYRLMIEEQ